MRALDFKQPCHVVRVRDDLRAVFTYLDSLDFSAAVYNGIIWCSKKKWKSLLQKAVESHFMILFTDYFCLMLGNNHFKCITAKE